jgi:hypothetical protein
MCFYRARREEEGHGRMHWPSMAMGAGGLHCIQGRGLNGEETEGVKEGGGGRWF